MVLLPFLPPHWLSVRNLWCSAFCSNLFVISSRLNKFNNALIMCKVLNRCILKFPACLHRYKFKIIIHHVNGILYCIVKLSCCSIIVKKVFKFRMLVSSGGLSHALYKPMWCPLGDVVVHSSQILKPSLIFWAVIVVSIWGGSVDFGTSSFKNSFVWSEISLISSMFTLPSTEDVINSVSFGLVKMLHAALNNVGCWGKIVCVLFQRKNALHLFYTHFAVAI